MKGYPVTIRLLDPPLHEFLPQDRESQEEMARAMGISIAEVQEKIEELREVNPMLGHRGCRLGIPILKLPKCKQGQLSKLH